VRAAVALGVAAVLFGAAVRLYRRRGATLRLMTHLRGYDRTPVGPRRRYQNGWRGQLDMAVPVIACLLLGLAFLIRALLALRD
jgi:hypothetical protein